MVSSYVGGLPCSCPVNVVRREQLCDNCQEAYQDDDLKAWQEDFERDNKALCEYEEKRDEGVKDCERCLDDGATLAPDPYSLDIHGDYTNYWLCQLCRDERAEGI
tara:strand:+ start:266 stop:580 length:315 start_codon:yes stop_codon:yes gene_type:complete